MKWRFLYSNSNVGMTNLKCNVDFSLFHALSSLPEYHVHCTQNDVQQQWATDDCTPVNRWLSTSEQRMYTSEQVTEHQWTKNVHQWTGDWAPVNKECAPVNRWLYTSEQVTEHQWTKKMYTSEQVTSTSEQRMCTSEPMTVHQWIDSSTRPVMVFLFIKVKTLNVPESNNWCSSKCITLA
jgi:hypothetical protein